MQAHDGPPPEDICAAARLVLATADPAAKAAASRRWAAAWRDGDLSAIGEAGAPERPARPERPALRPPREVPRRRIGSGREGRIALLHALAHIELNAIDLAWDIVARFAPAWPDPADARCFATDWLQVAEEEGKHYELLAARLTALDAAYGDLPAHDGLWQAAQETAGDLLARLAVVPLVLEARGLDVTPGMIERLRTAGDEDSAAVLEVIYAEEIGHVAIGKRWFDRLCAERRLAPEPTWRDLVARHFRGAVKPPFNEEGRSAAGLAPDFYAPLAS